MFFLVHGQMKRVVRTSSRVGTASAYRGGGFATGTTTVGTAPTSGSVPTPPATRRQSSTVQRTSASHPDGGATATRTVTTARMK